MEAEDISEYLSKLFIEFELLTFDIKAFYTAFFLIVYFLFKKASSFHSFGQVILKKIKIKTIIIIIKNHILIMFLTVFSLNFSNKK